ncbi:hypothetical protein [Nocardioides coralli]|uniref:hypothetical protein n=1 Tax=Nocardioides coralli TaxID=2872154 RepID=UPI001CA43617|nr:hypothetical protein [Nocardioides coralli]QZY28790.1 hypothetical protein K6T13_15240 [Nocardioides coralli]
MAEELRVPPAALDQIRAELGRGRSALEECGPSTPRGIDAGEMTAMLTGMLSRVLDSAAAMSEGLAAVSSQVGEAGTTFWETDASVATTYAGGRLRGVD